MGLLKSIETLIKEYYEEKKASEKAEKKSRKKDGYWKKGTGNKDKGIWYPFKD